MKIDKEMIGKIYELQRRNHKSDLHQVNGEEYLIKSKKKDNIGGSECFRFWIVDEEGHVLEEYRIRFDCDCEYGIYTEYEMKEGTLFKYFGRSNDAYTEVLTAWRADVVCIAWKEIKSEDTRYNKILSKMNLE
jgi:hypothetical protein